jgi:hypothetical protein
MTNVPHTVHSNHDSSDFKGDSAMNTINEYKAIHAGFRTLSYAEIREAIMRILAGKTKAQLKLFARDVGVILMPGGTKAQWQESFVRRVIEDKASYDRCQVRFGA